MDAIYEIFASICSDDVSPQRYIHAVPSKTSLLRSIELLGNMSTIIGDYKVGKLIGEGAFSKVKLGTHIQTGQKVAIKIINKKLMAESNEKSNHEKAKRAKKLGIKNIVTEQDPSTLSTINFINKLENEVQLLMRLDHPNVIRTYQVIDSEDECHVVMQYASGGEMTEHLAVKSKLTENEARKFFSQLVSGLDHIHQASIVHRDLKLENLLLDDKNNILITDFGLGRTYDTERVHLLDTFCGTPHYAAVELVSGIPYVGIKSDIWALGVILYFFVTGLAPFTGTSISELYNNIKKVRYDICEDFSLELVDLLDRILRKDPHDRISLEEMKEHPWFHINGRMEIPSIRPKISGKVNASKLGQIVKSINSEKSYQIYTFHYHDQQISSTNRVVEQTRQRSNSAVVARRKSISLKSDAQRPNLVAPISGEYSVRGSVSGEDRGGNAPSISMLTNTLDDEIETRARIHRPTITERPAFLALNPSNLALSASNARINNATEVITNSNLVIDGSNFAATKTNEQSNSSGLKMEGLSMKKPNLIRAGSDVGRQRASTVGVGRPLSPTAATSLVPAALLEEAEDKPTQMKFSFATRSRSFRKSANETHSPPSQEKGVLHEENSMTPIFNADGPLTGASIMRRLSMVSKPVDSADQNYEKDTAIANLDINALPMDEIAEWHAIHRPPKEIRIVKFNFRKGASSGVIDPASMFQDVHKILLELPEYTERKLAFKRHPDYYDFTCTYTENDTELLKFDIEICKVWLLDVHAVKIKRRQGDSYHFKRFYDKIVSKLNWAK